MNFKYLGYYLIIPGGRMVSFKKQLLLLLLAYIPGIFLPLVMSLGETLVSWFFMGAWVLYVFILLIVAYIIDRRGSSRVD